MGSTTKANHAQVPARQGKENSFLREKGVQRAVVNSAWFFTCGVLAKKEVSLSSS